MLFYLNEEIEKVFTLDCKGEEANELNIVLPTIIKTGEPFEIKIAAIDNDGYVSFKSFEPVRFIEIPFEKEIKPVFFKKDKPAIVFIKNVVCNREGIFRLAAEFKGKIYYSNPFVCEKKPKRRIFWGDPHVHTVLSDCMASRCRSIHFAYIAGRYFSFLDWISITDHVSNGRSSLGKWREEVFTAELYNDSFKYITIPGYEASFKGGSGGDNNIYLSKFPDYFVEDYENGTIKTVCEKLIQKAEEQNFEFFAVPHHTSRAVKHGEFSYDIYPGFQFMPAIEIYSKWGSSEYHGNPESLLKPHHGPSYVVDFLRKGFVAGFLAGTDTHTSIPSGKIREHIPYQPGFTAAITNTLTRQNIFNTIKRRRTYATAGERIFIDFRINEKDQGNVIKSRESQVRKIFLKIASQSEIKIIEVIRNGEIIYSEFPGVWVFEKTIEDSDIINNFYLESPVLKRFVFYYIRVRTKSGGLGWSSPVFIVYE